MYLLRTSLFKTGIVINRSRLILTKMMNYAFLLSSLAMIFLYFYIPIADRISLVMSITGLMVVSTMPDLFNSAAKQLHVEKFDNQNHVVVFDVILINIVLRFALLAMIIAAIIYEYR